VSVIRLTSQPSALLLLQSANPLLQANRQLPLTHAADALFPPRQTLPQPPQFCKLEPRSLSHPLAMLLSQLPKPVEQMSPQVFPAHVLVELGRPLAQQNLLHASVLAGQVVGSLPVPV